MNDYEIDNVYQWYIENFSNNFSIANFINRKAFFSKVEEELNDADYFNTLNIIFFDDYKFNEQEEIIKIFLDEMRKRGYDIEYIKKCNEENERCLQDIYEKEWFFSNDDLNNKL
jgi:hypothetical protein